MNLTSHVILLITNAHHFFPLFQKMSDQLNDKTVPTSALQKVTVVTIPPKSERAPREDAMYGTCLFVFFVLQR